MIAAVLNSPFNFGAPAPPPGGDPDFSSVVLLLHCDGTNGSTTFTDSSSSAKTVTAVGNAQISTASPKFGTGALLLDGTGDYLSIPADADFDFGTGDFTIEFAVNFQGSGQQYLMDYSSVNTSVISITPSSGNMFVYSQGSFCINAGSTPFSLNTWYNIAVVRSGGTWTIYRDGVQYLQATGQTTRTFGSSALNLYIGIAGNGGVAAQATVDEWRMTRVARTISVPTEAYPDS